VLHHPPASSLILQGFSVRFDFLLLLLALVASCAAQDQCANWCSRWTCSNTEFCGGCGRRVCEQQNPHPMCADTAQPYCGAPRCEKWCNQVNDEACGRAECSGCSKCEGHAHSSHSSHSSHGHSSAVERNAHASPFPAPEVVFGGAVHRQLGERENGEPTCDQAYLTSLRTELRSMIGLQTARNQEIRASLGER